MNTETIFYLPFLIKKLAANFIVKLFGGTGFAAVFGFFFDVQNTQALTALLFLIVFDLISGVVCAYKIGEKIRSSKIFRTAIKITIYFLMISSAHLAMLAGVDFQFVTIESVIIGFLALTELISILENAAKMGYVLPRRIINQLENYKVKK